MSVEVVVPCYNEADRLDLSAIDRFLQSSSDIALTFVNDGSTDATLPQLETIRERWPQRVHVVDQQPNRGKAEAVRVGVLSALNRGVEYVGYWDADLATPLEAIDEAKDALLRHEGVDIVLGARVALLGRHIQRKASRHYLGRVFATAASLTLGIAVYDTQCGAKLFRVRNDTRRLFQEPFNSRWIFDVEIIARYLEIVGHDEHGLYELPLRRWTDIGESKVRPIDFIRALGEMAQLYRRYSLLRNFRWAVATALSPPARYAMVGAVGTVVHYLVLALLVELGVASASAATAIGAAVGAVVNYVLNYHFTFASSRSHTETIPRFLIVAALGMSVSALGLLVATDALGMHYLLAQMICTATVLALGYLLNRLWTFGQTSDAPVFDDGRNERLQSTDKPVDQSN